jgi:hypothetical protein
MTYISLGVIHTSNNLRLRDEHLTLLLRWNSLPDHHLDPVAVPPTLLITDTNRVFERNFSSEHVIETATRSIVCYYDKLSLLHNIQCTTNSYLG